MKTRFYLMGTLIGLFVGIPVVLLGIGGRALFILVTASEFALPIALGYCVAICLAYWIDSISAGSQRGLFRSIAIHELIFLTGSASACSLNVLLNGRILGQLSSLPEEVWDWFVKPMFWLAYIGVPSAAIIGLIAYGLGRALNKND